MIEDLVQQQRELDRAKIVSETAKIPWRELQRYFAGGKVIWITAGLDLVDVAEAIQRDDLPSVQVWTESGKLAPASDDQAKRWIAGDALLWAVVIKPWVLVQEIESGA